GGWDGFPLTSRSRTLPPSTAMSVLLDGYLSRSKRRHSRCPGERVRKDRRTRYESARQAELGASSILSRTRRRYGGRRGGSARPPGPGRYREPPRETETPLQKKPRRPNPLPRQSLSPPRDATPPANQTQTPPPPPAPP